MRLSNKRSLVTGGAQGIGQAIAETFGREGAIVYIADVNEDTGAEAVSELRDKGHKATFVRLNVSEEADWQRAVGQIEDETGGLDILVNNAGIGQRSLAKDTSLDVDRRVMEIDFFAPIALTKLVLPRMIKRQGGMMIVTSSVAGKHAVPFHTAYCAAKHALHGYYDTLRIEHLKDNIDVMLLVIAGIKSNVFEHALTGDGSEYGKSDYMNSSGMTAEACAERVVEAIINREPEVVISIEEAIQALRLKDKDPAAFNERMANMMEWMANQ